MITHILGYFSPTFPHPSLLLIESGRKRNREILARFSKQNTIPDLTLFALIMARTKNGRLQGQEHTRGGVHHHQATGGQPQVQPGAGPSVERGQPAAGATGLRGHWRRSRGKAVNARIDAVNQLNGHPANVQATTLILLVFRGEPSSPEAEDRRGKPHDGARHSCLALSPREVPRSTSPLSPRPPTTPPEAPWPTTTGKSLRPGRTQRQGRHGPRPSPRRRRRPHRRRPPPSKQSGTPLRRSAFRPQGPRPGLRRLLLPGRQHRQPPREGRHPLPRGWLQ
jgi:hypothetical protein